MEHNIYKISLKNQEQTLKTQQVKAHNILFKCDLIYSS